MKKPKLRNYRKLGSLMWEHCLDQKDLAEILKDKEGNPRSATYVSNRFAGEAWRSMGDMYAISDHFKQLTDGDVDISANFTEYFPHPDTIHNIIHAR